MFNLKSLSILGLLIFVQMSGVSSAQNQDVILKYVPSDANMVSVLNVEALLESPLGVEEGWSEKHKEAHLDGSLTIPPWVKLFVQTSQFNPAKRGDLWSAAFSPLENDFDFESVAKKEGAEVQEVRGTPVVLSSRWQGYFVELHPKQSVPDERLLGLIRGVSRQEMSNWLGKSGEDYQLSSYLREAVEDKKPQLIIAYDMNDMLDPTHVSYRLGGATSLKGHPLEQATLKLTFQSLKGVRIAVTVEEEIHCEIKLDFNRSLGPESKYIQPLLVELMNDAGAELEEVATARQSVVKNSYVLKTPLSRVSFRKLLSLISTPHPTVEAEATPDTSTSEADKPDLLASQRYYKAVIKNLEDLEKAYQSRKPTYGRSAVWHKSYANRIQHLPKYGVHPDLIKFGESMADGLLQLSDSLRGTDAETRQLQSKVRTSTEYKYNPKTGYEWWWGPARTPNGYVMTPSNTDVIVHSNLDEVRARQFDAAKKGDSKREQIWQSMADERDAIQNEMLMVFGRTFLQ